MKLLRFILLFVVLKLKASGFEFDKSEEKPILLVSNTSTSKVYNCNYSLVEITTTSSYEFNLKWLNNGAVILGQNTGTLFTDKIGKYTVIREYANGILTESEPLEIVFGSPPALKILSNKSSFCEGSEVVLSHDNPGVGASWYLDGNRIGVYDTLVSKSGGSFKVQYGGLFGCSIVENTIDIVKLNNPPIPSPNNLQFSTCADKKFDLIVPGISNYKYEWFRNDISISNSNILSTSIFGIYQVRILDSNTNCSTLSNYFILSEDSDCSIGNIFFPNVITPNDDGVNDELSIKNIENFPEYFVEIFDRWGMLLLKKNSSQINSELQFIKFNQGLYLIFIRESKSSKLITSKSFLVVR